MPADAKFSCAGLLLRERDKIVDILCRQLGRHDQSERRPMVDCVHAGEILHRIEFHTLVQNMR